MTQIPRYWRLRGSFLRMEGSNCQNCGKKHFPGRPVCPDCGYIAGRIKEEMGKKIYGKEGAKNNWAQKERL